MCLTAWPSRSSSASRISTRFVLGVKELDADESKPHPVSSFSASTGPGVFSFYDWPDDGRTPARGLRRVDQIAIGGVRVCDAVA